MTPRRVLNRLTNPIPNQQATFSEQTGKKGMVQNNEAEDNQMHNRDSNRNLEVKSKSDSAIATATEQTIESAPRVAPLFFELI